MQPRFKLRHAVVVCIVALVFAFNGLLTGVIDASVASGGSEFALITCLGGQVPGEAPGQPGQSDHASKCGCSLSSCCCASSLARNADEIDGVYAVGSAAALLRTPNLIERDFRADHPLHLRSPPAIVRPEAGPSRMPICETRARGYAVEPAMNQPINPPA